MKTFHRVAPGPIFLLIINLVAPLAESRAEDVIISQFDDGSVLWRFDYGGVTKCTKLAPVYSTRYKTQSWQIRPPTIVGRIVHEAHRA